MTQLTIESEILLIIRGDAEERLSGLTVLKPFVDFQLKKVPEPYVKQILRDHDIADLLTSISPLIINYPNEMLADLNLTDLYTLKAIFLTISENSPEESERLRDGIVAITTITNTLSHQVIKL